MRNCKSSLSISVTTKINTNFSYLQEMGMEKFEFDDLLIFFANLSLTHKLKENFQL